MTTLQQPHDLTLPWYWRERVAAYYELCKPKVVMLMLITAVVGMCLASPTLIPFSLLLTATVGIGLSAASAAVINHIVDQRIDIIMARTHRRPIPTGKVNTAHALIFAAVLACLGLGILWAFVNPVTTFLTFFTLIGYAVIYTMFLKRATPQNIVVGGLAGAAPPLLGWTAVSGHITADSLLLVLIIYTWTPPHFWALAIYRLEDYARAEIPMLPVTHGVRYTKINIVLYTLLLIACSLLPFATGMSGWIYLIGSSLLGMRFLWWTIKLWRTEMPKIALQTFWFSIYYLFILFIVLLVDHYWSGIMSIIHHV